MALALSLLCLGATLWFGDWKVALAYAGLLGSAGVWYAIVVRRGAPAPAP